MSKPGRSRVIRLAEAQAGIPGPAGERAVMVLQRGTLDVALGLPLRPSQQTPHAQDEIYFIIRGRGVLIHESKRDRASIRGHYRGPRPVACILRPSWWRGPSIERGAGRDCQTETLPQSKLKLQLNGVFQQAARRRFDSDIRLGWKNATE